MVSGRGVKSTIPPCSLLTGNGNKRNCDVCRQIAVTGGNKVTSTEHLNLHINVELYPT
jgi:hypothetical protein